MTTYSNKSKAVEFKCKSYVIVNDLKAFGNIQAGFSIGCWIEWRKPNFLDEECFIENPGENPYMLTSPSTAAVFAYNDYQDPSGVDGTRLTLKVPENLTISNSGASKSTEVELKSKKWHFLMFTFDTSARQKYMITTYVDGVAVGSPKSLYHDEGFDVPNNKVLGIGCPYSNGGEEDRWRGGIAEFQIWEGILSPEKIGTLMNNIPEVSKETKLRFFLPLSKVENNGSADPFTNRVPDSSGRIEAYGF